MEEASKNGKKQIMRRMAGGIGTEKQVNSRHFREIYKKLININRRTLNCVNCRPCCFN